MNDGKKKKPQYYQNKKAFKITFQPHVQLTHQKISLENLCQRCVDQLQWKKQFNKYKKMTQLARCHVCNQKNIYRSYMKVCQICVAGSNMCAKCMETDFKQPNCVPQNPYQKQQRQKEEELQIQNFMKNVRERSRRTIRRGMQKGTIQWDRQLQYFVNEEGEKLDNIHFRRSLEEDEGNWVDDSNDQGSQDNEEDISSDMQENIDQIEVDENSKDK